MAWWREARFGMFVHWGLYAIPAGKWGEATTHGEWIRDTAKIPVAEYDRLRERWDPAQFDADAWAKAAADAGMKYLVITSKHHDGFALFDSAHGDHDIGSTSSTNGKRDVLAELAAACEKRGVRFGTYHSIMDWHHPDYLPRRPWEATTRSMDDADFDRFEKYLHAQVTEVVQRYRPGVMWFDGEWEPTWTHERGVKLFDLCRSLAPELIVNNRVDVHRGGMSGFSMNPDARGDYATPEQEIPANGLPGVDWESCMTMNDHWGWNAADTNWKSTKELVRNLIDIASKGGNYLLNVGPRADGTFPPEAVQRLAEIGAWTKTNGEAIHGTTASPFDPLPWGRCTVKTRGDTTTLYFHVFDWPANGVLELPRFATESVGWNLRLLGRPDDLVMWESAELFASTAPRVKLPSHTTPDPIAAVVAVDVKGRFVASRAPRITADSDRFVSAIDVAIASPDPAIEVRATTDGTEPHLSLPRVTSLRLDSTCTVKARAWHRGVPFSDVVERTFTKVEPIPAVKVLAKAEGLRVEQFAVDWQSIPDDRSALRATTTFASPTVGFATNPGERTALRFTGFVDVPDDALWHFAITSDDGSKLWIENRLVVDNDGPHGPIEKCSDVPLAKGLHPIEVVWFNRTGDAALELRWSRDGRTFTPVPAAALRH